MFYDSIVFRSRVSSNRSWESILRHFTMRINRSPGNGVPLSFSKPLPPET